MERLNYETDARLQRLVEWLCSDPRGRGTQDDIASELGVSPRMIRKWKERDDVQEAWRKLATQVGGSPETMQRILEALAEQAVDPTSQKQVQAAKTWAQMTGAIAPPEAPKTVNTDFMDMSRDELERYLADRLGVGVGDRVDSEPDEEVIDNVVELPSMWEQGGT